MTTAGVRSPRSEVRTEPPFLPKRRPAVMLAGKLLALAALTALAGCGGGGGGGTTTSTPTTPTTVANTIPIAVNSGPANNAINFAYVTVQVCNPGSTTSCATIPNVQLDTGSSGLRILSSASGVNGLSLTQVAPGGTPIDECYQFGDGSYVWGPVMQADVIMAGEKAASLPIQVIDSGTSPSNVPSSCGAGAGANRGTSTLLQANGILGVGAAQQDCGINCTGTTVQPYYWQCPASGSCVLSSLAAAIQVSNPVIFFNSDNNGVAVTLSSVGATGAASSSGTLAFGVGTQTDNALGSANIYPLAFWSSGYYAGAYTIQSTYNSVAYPGFVDSGSSLLFFLDPATTGMSACSGSYSSLYCPSSNMTFTVSNMGYQGTAANATINIGNALSLLPSQTNSGFTAFDNLAAINGTGASNDAIVFGLPFFFGKTVFVGVAGKTPPSGAPSTASADGYWAF